MPATLVTKTAKTGDTSPTTFPLGFLDRAGDGSSLAPLHGLLSAAGALINPATAEGIEACRALLASLLTATQAQRVETIWTDDTGTRFIRVDIGGTIVWTDVAGNAASAPGTGARPDNDSGSAVSRQSFKATASGTGYSSGDYLDHIVVSDESGDPVGNFWINVSSGAKITAPSNASVTMVSALPEGAATQATLEALRALVAAGIGVTPAPTEGHLGAVGGEGAHPTFTPVATALTYATGKCIGGLNDLTGFLRLANKSALIQSATLRSKAAIAVPVDLVIFRDVPSVTTGLVDGATFTVDPGDVGKVSKVISFSTWNSLGTASLATVDGIGKYMALASGTTAKCILVARGSVTLSTASDVTGSTGLIQD